MSDYGIKVTTPGKDITSSTVGDYVLWSKYKNPKTYIVGTASFHITDEAYSQSNHHIVTITHNLGYAPLVFLYWNTGSNYGNDTLAMSQWTPHYAVEYIGANADNTHFTIEYIYWNLGLGDGLTGLGGTSYNFKYYIMIDPMF